MFLITAAAWVELSKDVLGRLPEEACGILLGRGDTAVEVWPCRNVYAGDRARNYELAPQDQFDCARHARSTGLELVAYYHSHPNGSTRFSETDRVLALPGSRHVIIPVKNGELRHPHVYRVLAAAEESAGRKREIGGDCGRVDYSFRWR